jgi:GNAT superfamily N-acetyltransferase
MELNMSSLTDRQANSAQKHIPYRTSQPFHINVHHLTSRDEMAIRSFLLRLDCRSRVARFGHSVSDEALVHHVNYAFGKAFWIAGARIDRQLCGLVELYNSGSGWLEAAFVVEQQWRRRGVAWMLLHAAKERAAGTDIGALRMFFPRNNWPMRQLASKANAKLDLVLGELSAEVVVDSTLARCRIPG